MFSTRRIPVLLLLLLSVILSDAKTVRVLTIGNSFAENALTFLPQIVEASGNTLIFNKANLGGCTLERHWKHVAKYEANHNDPEGSPYSNGLYSLNALLKNENWDYVTVQQVSWQSHDLKTYYPYITDLHKYIRNAAPQADILAHQIWAYRVDDPRFIPENKGKEPHTHREMYEQVREAYHHIAEAFDLGLLPSGDAMYLADIDSTWGFKPDATFDPERAKYPSLPDPSHSLHAGYSWRQQNEDPHTLRIDGHHASEAGKYLLGCVWFEVLFNEDVLDNAFIPEGMDPAYAHFLQETAHRVVQELK